MIKNPSTGTAPHTPKGPRGLPLIGILPEFAQDNLGFLLRVQAEYGDVVRYRLGNRTIYQVNHPDGIQRVLQDNHTNYTKQGFEADFMDLIVGEGLFTSDGPHWLRQRRLMQPAFHHRQVDTFAQIMLEVAEETITRWRSAAKHNQLINPLNEMMHLTLDVVNRALFSTQIDALAGEKMPALAEALGFLIKEVAYRFERPFYPLWAPTSRNRAYKAAVQTLDEIIYSLIEARRSLITQDPGRAPQDLLTTLLTAQDAEDGEQMSDQQVRDEVMTLFIAGHETTAAALSWAWILLAQHPEVEEKLHAELDEVLKGAPLDPSQLQDLRYTRLVIDETLRLYPPAWITNRTPIEADVLCGYSIPAGEMVAVSPYAAQRNPKFWERPDRFIPERFSPERRTKRPKYAYFPFGGGPRLCIGQGFALTEATLVLASLGQHFRLRLNGSHAVKPQAGATLRPDQKIHMLVEER